MVQNKGLYYISHPDGQLEVGKHIRVETHDFDENQELAHGAVAVKVHYASFDPYLRGRMRKPGAKSYSAPFEIGKPLNNATIASIIKSNNQDFQPRDIIHLRRSAIEEYIVLSQDELKNNASKLDNPYKLVPRVFLGALGMPGLTAYSSFYALGEPKKGETIFISAASGAVGQLVGQLAKHEGLKVIGSVGDDKKLDFILHELDFDGGFNYKKEDAHAALARLAPEGIDIYYENVGGEQLEAALAAMNLFGRIVACGMISQYNKSSDDLYGVKNMTLIVTKRLKMQGFIVSDENMGPKYSSEHQKNVQKWIAEGSFKVQDTVTKGMDNAGDGLLSLFDGRNFGKAVLEIAPLPSIST